MAASRPWVPFERLVDTSDIAHLLVRNSGDGNHVQLVSQLMSCSKKLRGSESLELVVKQQEETERRFSEGAEEAFENLRTRPDDLSFVEVMRSYEDKFFVFEIIDKIVDARLDNELHIGFANEHIPTMMMNVFCFCETYNWSFLCEHITEYQEFVYIVHKLLRHIFLVVLDIGNAYHSYIVAEDGITQEEYSDHQRLILGKMGDAGVVHCLWRVCQYHKTSEMLHRDMFCILHYMIKSRSIHYVRDILKTPGNMALIHKIMLDSDPEDYDMTDYSSTVLPYAEIVNAMFSSDPVFDTSEEILVVSAVHTVIAKWSTQGLMQEYALCMLLESICTRVRDSTLRKLTDTQIDFLCNDPLVISVPVATQYVSTLLYRALAANNEYDTTSIDPFFRRQES